MVMPFRQHLTSPRNDIKRGVSQQESLDYIFATTESVDFFKSFWRNDCVSINIISHALAAIEHDKVDDINKVYTKWHKQQKCDASEQNINADVQKNKNKHC